MEVGAVQQLAEMGDPRRSGARRWLFCIAAAALWIASGGALQALRWFTSYGPLLGAVLPETLPGTVWMRPGAWGVLTVILGGIALALVTLTVAGLLQLGSGRPGRRPAAGGRAAVWLATILAGTILGAVTDLARFAALPPGMGLRSALSVVDLGATAAHGAYWGALYGWIIALIAAPRIRSGGSRALSAAADGRHPVGPPLRVIQRPIALIVVSLIAVAAYAIVSVGGDRSWHRQTQAEAAEAERAAAVEAGTPRTGSAPDPYATGEAVPARASASEGAVDPSDRGPRACAAEEMTLMYGDADAATGHRLQTLRVVNGGESACVLQGYPDIAFADQNGHLLDVTVEHGPSFMAQEDPGPLEVSLGPGEWAITRIGWNANSTQGSLVATEIYAALLPGDERHPWPPSAPFDIVPGATVAVTAWAADSGPVPSDP